MEVESEGLLKTGAISVLLHLALIILLMVGLRSGQPAGGSPVYRVTVRPFSTPGGGNPLGGSRAAAPVGKERIAKVPETRAAKVERPVALPPPKRNPDPVKTDDTVGLKKALKKIETHEKEQASNRSLQDALADIRKKAAIDEIQKRIAGRGAVESRAAPAPSEGTTASASRGAAGSGSVSGAGTASASGPGTGTGSGLVMGTGTGTGSGGSSIADMYYSTVYARIKREWSLPENLPKGTTELEAVIVLVIDKDGKVQKTSFEKKSGNSLYDQMALRAIKKAEPFPPPPREVGEPPCEIGIRFYPE